MTKPNVRERLLDAGVETFHRCGFNGCGVQEITEAAGVPKGSFYNHFASKEALGAAVLDRYWQQRAGTTLRILEDTDIAARERLRRYFAAMAESMAKRGHTRGCLIGNLGLELADQSQLVCERLAAVFAGWTGAVETCIRQGQREGDIRADCDAAMLAAFLINAWEGTILRAKVDKNTAPFDEFDEVVFGKLLASASNSKGTNHEPLQ
jgi:TetR/AcrR family transcriptional regulator, transcriptional repressor for nem operon